MKKTFRIMSKDGTTKVDADRIAIDPNANLILFLNNVNGSEDETVLVGTVPSSFVVLEDKP